MAEDTKKTVDIKTRWGQKIRAKIDMSWSKKKVATQLDQRMLSKGLDIIEKTYGDSSFIEQITRVESDMGRHKSTYRKDYYGGVAQVDKIGFEATQDLESHPRLAGHLNKLKEEHGIDWTKTKWEDLRNPMNSVIAARLLLLTKPDKLPSKLKDRAQYWKDHYNTSEGAGSPEDFIAKNGGQVEEKEEEDFNIPDGTYQDSSGGVIRVENGSITKDVSGNFVDDDGKMMKVQDGKIN